MKEIEAIFLFSLVFAILFSMLQSEEPKIEGSITGFVEEHHYTNNKSRYLGLKIEGCDKKFGFSNPSSVFKKMVNACESKKEVTIGYQKSGWDIFGKKTYGVVTFKTDSEEILTLEQKIQSHDRQNSRKRITSWIAMGILLISSPFAAHSLFRRIKAKKNASKGKNSSQGRKGPKKRANQRTTKRKNSS